ncbi:O-acetyl-ADP-ribose deacetylase [Eubacteriaceae bacterium ES3]|nr:O-acetyl-ADP-ribose deacetylase [Eubacteriaceae bacterium ES3]
MGFQIVRNDITKMKADAIVNAANQSLLGGGGVDGAIHRAAGPKLLDECKTLGGCETGQAKITGGYKLPAKYVIHTVGPVWEGGSRNEEKLLRSCYQNSLILAADRGLKSIAFPLISAGAYGYPRDQALRVAVYEIGNFLLEHEMEVTLVVYDQASFKLSENLYSAISQYIDERYADENSVGRGSDFTGGQLREQVEFLEMPAAASIQRLKSQRKLDDLVNQVEESFSESLLRLIDEKGMTDAETYKRANIDRKLFSKIRNDKSYHPGKQTAIAFAIALHLNLDETRDLLARAGFALSHSNRADIIIEYFIEERNYNIFEINEALFAFEQKLLGL